MDVAVAIPPRRVAAWARDVLVIGLGNILLGDDGVGVHAVRRLATERHPFLRPLDGGTLGFRLMDAVMQSGAVLFIDAAELCEHAGAVRLLEQDELDGYMRRGGRMSAHEAGLVDLLTLLRLDGWAPAHLAVLGIQPHRVDWDERLSDPVARALPEACGRAVATVARWQAPA